MITFLTYKAVKGVDDSVKDRVEALIPLVYDYLSKFSGWTDLTVINMIEYNLTTQVGLQSQSLGDYTSSYTTNYPESVTRDLKRKVKFV